MGTIIVALLLLAAVMMYACCRAGGDADEFEHKCYTAAYVDPETAEIQAEADMLREAMEEDHW